MSGVREVVGCFAKQNDTKETPKPIILEEYPGMIWLDACTYARGMTPNQARFLAQQLKRLADKIDPPPLSELVSTRAAKGGHAAAAALTSEERTARAKAGAAARWKDKGQKA